MMWEEQNYVVLGVPVIGIMEAENRVFPASVGSLNLNDVRPRQRYK